MGTLIMIVQLLLGLSIIVGLHELGHLVSAKMFGIRVERYSIGFPPKIFGFRWGETEYTLGALPLGGYVKIAGMIDESLDTDYIKESPKDYEFRSKPAWQRLIVMMGGIIVNVVTGIMMFIGLAYFIGEQYLPMSELKHGIVAHEAAEKMGLKTGDHIIAINGKEITKYRDILSADGLLSSDSYYTVVRDKETLRVEIPNNLVETLSDRKNPQRFIDPVLPFKVGEVIPNKPAAKAGLQKGDKIVAFNGEKLEFFHEFQALQQAHKNEEVTLTIIRNKVEKELKVKTQEDGTLGFYPDILIDYAQNDYSIGEATQKGTILAFGSVINNIKGFAKVFKGEVSTRSLSGPIGIAQIFGSQWNWERFWQITAVLSMWLAFLNFLPIPALDGGHVLFLSYEMISGQKLSDRFLENSQKVGILILLTLMVFIIFNDIFNLFF